MRAKLRGAPSHLLGRVGRKTVIDAFHGLYYREPESHTGNRFLGRRVTQLPSDLWLYQELVHDEKPAFVLQTGVAHGGSLLWFAHLLDVNEASPEAVVVGIDIVLSDEAKTLNHPRIRLVEGSSTDPETVAEARALLPADHGLVSLDSDHSAGHVFDELRIYSEFVAPGRHLVVEDTNVNGHPVYPSHGPGPMEAVDRFLAENPSFRHDEALWRRQLLSFHSWLVRT